jgi:hypothetical protein
MSKLNLDLRHQIKVSKETSKFSIRLHRGNNFVVRVDQRLQIEIHYHPRKANIVVDALNRKEHCNHIALIPTIKEEIITMQKADIGMGHIRRRLQLGEVKCFREDVDGVLRFKNHIVVRKDFELCRKIMDEAHFSRYSIHSEMNKMYQDLKKNFWWTRMKREITKYVAKCDTCRRVKADHLKPARNLQPWYIPEWKWKDICMDFIVSLPRTSLGYDSIWFIVDCLTKSAHFIPVCTRYRARHYTKLYITNIVSNHGISKTSSLTEDPSLSHVSGNNCMIALVPISITIKLITLRLTVKLRE